MSEAFAGLTSLNQNQKMQNQHMLFVLIGLWITHFNKMNWKAKLKVTPVKYNLRLHELVQQVGHVISCSYHLQRRVILVH